jgi:putative sterol carrier protein
MTTTETTDDTAARIETALEKPADELVALITGNADPIQGFMQQQFDMDDDIQKGTRLAATMTEPTRLLPG